MRRKCQPIQQKHQISEMKMFDNTKTHQIYEMRMFDNTKLCQIYEMQMLGNTKHGNTMG